MEEIETKILEFDEQALRKKLTEKGAKYEGKHSYTRVVFYMRSKKPEDDEFIRVRTDGQNSTLTWKYRNGSKKSLDNTDEIEVGVEDFEKTVEIVSKLWKGDPPFRQENMIEKWNYNGIEITIAKWPLIPPYLELEANSEKQVRNAIKELEIKGEEIGNTNLAAIFIRYGQKGKDGEDLKF